MNEPDRVTGEPRAEFSRPDRASLPPWSLFPDWRSWIRDLVISLGIAGVVIVFLYQPVKVEGTSMMPRLTDQERIFINKFVYRFEPIHRGDVVVFHYPLDRAKSYIKRVIGLPGETVQMVEGEVFINGRKLPESYVLPNYRDHQSHGPIVVPHNEFYVLGDHRNSSNDSRLWGTVARKNIYGKAVFVYWPMERFGFVE